MNSEAVQTLTVSNKGQVVIPSALREALGISPGSTVEVRREGNGVLISLKSNRPKSTLDAGYGMLKYSGPKKLLSNFEVVAHMRSSKAR